jgi:hypothetical protein
VTAVGEKADGTIEMTHMRHPVDDEENPHSGSRFGTSTATTR